MHSDTRNVYLSLSFKEIVPWTLSSLKGELNKWFVSDLQSDPYVVWPDPKAHFISQSKIVVMEVKRGNRLSAGDGMQTAVSAVDAGSAQTLEMLLSSLLHWTVEDCLRCNSIRVAKSSTQQLNMGN